jgi:quinol monooxygenase YgiN
MSPNRIVEYVRYAVAADRADALIDAYRRALPHLEASPHCLSVELTRCHEDPTHFILRLEWDSLAGHLEGFRKSAVFTPFLAEIRPFIDAIEEMRHYELTDVVLQRRASI